MFTKLNSETLNRFRSLYFTLAPDYPHSVLLDSCGFEGKTGGFYLMGFEADAVVELVGNQLIVNGRRDIKVDSKKVLWQRLGELFPFTSPPHPTLSPNGGEGSVSPHPHWERGRKENTLVGTLGYELNHLLEPTVPFRSVENPLLYLVLFRHVIKWYPESDCFRIVSPDSQWAKAVESLIPKIASPPHPNPLPQWERGGKYLPLPSLSKREFEDKVLEIKEHIRQGNIYQANLSIRFETYTPSPPMGERVGVRGNSTLSPIGGEGRVRGCTTEMFSLYNELVTRNPSPFSGIFQTPEMVVLSNSPERLVKKSSGSGIIETRPIAGTRGRGKTEEEESRIARVLKTDPKEQAEHMMLLDLERNDLGRVSIPGSVNVPELCILEKYSHVTHIVSQVEGKKSLQCTEWDILDAMFPGGTITGCPKVRCMEILHDIEPVPRGFYTGSLGYIDSEGNMDFNILIRSLFRYPDGRLHFHAGAGIVADSVPLWEYNECLRKAEVIQGVLCHDYQFSTT